MRYCNISLESHESKRHFVSSSQCNSNIPFCCPCFGKKTRKFDMVTHINDKNDLVTKLNDASDQLVVIDFFATWCGPCKMISPKLEELAQEFQNVLIFKVDVDECEDIAMEYNISSMPTFVFVKNNTVITQFSGANYDKLKQLVQEHK